MPNHSSLVEIHLDHYGGNEAVLENPYAFVPEYPHVNSPQMQILRLYNTYHIF